MTLQEIMAQLEAKGTDQTRKIYRNHGGEGEMYGVKISDLKLIQKKIKKDHELSLELFRTGNMDAQYLAGLVADEKRISEKQLDDWAHNSRFYMISEFTVAWVAAESAHGWDLAAKWIADKNERVQSAGWSTYANLVSLVPDDQLNLQLLENLLQKLGTEIHSAPNRVRYTMNSFVISVGGYVAPLSAKAKQIGEKIGKVKVDLGNTACKVPSAPEYIQKMVDRGTPGTKKKQARC